MLSLLARFLPFIASPVMRYGKIAVLAAVVSAAVYSGWWARTTVYQSQEAKAWQAQTEALRAEIARREQIIVEREKQSRRLQNQLAANERAYNEALTSDEITRKWAAEPVPPAAIDLLRSVSEAVTGPAGCPTDAPELCA